jgi:hypothetical protein
MSWSRRVLSMIRCRQTGVRHERAPHPPAQAPRHPVLSLAGERFPKSTRTPACSTTTGTGGTQVLNVTGTLRSPAPTPPTASRRSASGPVDLFFPQTRRPGAEPRSTSAKSPSTCARATAGPACRASPRDDEGRPTVPGRGRKSCSAQRRAPHTPARPPHRGVSGGRSRSQNRGADVAPCEPPGHRHRRPATGTFDQLTRQPTSSVCTDDGQLAADRALETQAGQSLRRSAGGRCRSRR